MYRTKLFEWIDNHFKDLDNTGSVTYGENITLKADKDSKRLVSIIEVNCAVNLKEAPETFLDKQNHLDWKKEIEEILGILPTDRFRFAVSVSKQYINPDEVDLIRGRRGELIQKNQVRITINLFKKSFITEK